MKRNSAYCFIGGLLFLAGASLAHAQAIATSVQNEFANTESDNSSVSAAVNSQVEAQTKQNLDNLQENLDNSTANGNAALIRAFEPATNEFGNAAMEADQKTARSAFGYAPSIATQVMFEPAKKELRGDLVDGAQQDLTLIPGTMSMVGHLSVVGRPGGNYTETQQSTYGVKIVPGVTHRIVTRGYVIPFASPGEYTDSTRERVLPSPTFNSSKRLFSFTPKISVLNPDFDDTVQPHYFYGHPMSPVGRTRFALNYSSRPATNPFRQNKLKSIEPDLNASGNLLNTTPDITQGLQPSDSQITSSPGQTNY